MTLYEIDNTIQELLDSGMVIDEETGEVLFDEENLAELQIAKEEKIENIILYIKNLDAEASAIHNEISTMKQRQKQAENKAERLREYVKGFLDGEKFSTPRCAVSFRKTTVVKVDEEHLPTEWWKARLSPDKESIKKALKSGKEIEGAVLVDNISMSIK